ncbi:bloodthirsty-related gene family, member 2 [Brachyhypopomus gauderio]|uniref:bloodthirsty-related gene family, member 2 n=1 Tax=Brachyhypopomus gauderio TaxID=698409 RepID=UPI0040424BBE
MASTIGLLSEKHFLCSLCEDIFSRPVTTPCGHSFCKVCLHKYWNRSGSGKCPLCGKSFISRTHLSVNRTLADVTEHYRKSRSDTKIKALSLDGLLNEAVEVRSDADVEHMIEQRVQKVDKLRQSLKIVKSTCIREVQESQRVFSILLSSLEEAHKDLVASVEEKQKEAERRVDRLVDSLEKEILELKEMKSEHPLNSREHLTKSFSHLPREMRDWSKVSLETDPCVGFTRRAVVDFMNTVKFEADKLSKAEVRRLQKYSVEVSMNRHTAHPTLAVSEDRKEVRHTGKQQEVPENPKRFDRVTNILAKEAFGSGRQYWEVEVGDKSEWDLGVAKQSVNRKGRFTVSPANGFWVVSLRNGCQYTANTVPPTGLPLVIKPRKVGVYLDYSEGRVSFFCVDSGSHIHTFTDTFSEKLHPIFCPGRTHGGKNTAPLIITTSCCSI